MRTWENSRYSRNLDINYQLITLDIKLVPWSQLPCGCCSRLGRLLLIVATFWRRACHFNSFLATSAAWHLPSSVRLHWWQGGITLSSSADIVQTLTLTGMRLSLLGALRTTCSTSVVGFSCGLGCVDWLIMGALFFPISFAFACKFFISLAAHALSSALVGGLSCCRYCAFSITVKLINGNLSYKFSKITILTSNMYSNYMAIVTWHFMTYHLPVP